MNALTIKNFGFTSLFQGLFTGKNDRNDEQQFSSAINGLSRYDVSYVYHHLYEGRSLTLKVSLNRVEVYYRTHKLGYLPELPASRILKLIEKGVVINAAITNIKKMNFTTINGIELRIKIEKKVERK